MQIVVQDLMVHYDRQGSGKTILLLHGWADSLATFDKLQLQLAQKYDVISLDLPGFGQTQMPKKAWDLDDYAHFVQAFLAKLSVSSLHGLIGHSNGGALAIRALGENYLKADKLVLLAASGVRDTAKAKRLAIKTVAKTGKAMTFWLPESSRQKLQKKLYGSIGSDMLVAPHMQETFKQTVRQDIQGDAAKLTTPTLLIYGSDDKATSVVEVGKVLHGLIKGSGLEIIEGADHFVHQAAAEQVSNAVKEFLA